jgi:K+-transporting ATPase A subunit
MKEILIVQCVKRFKPLYDKSSKDFEVCVKKEMIWSSFFISVFVTRFFRGFFLFSLLRPISCKTTAQAAASKTPSSQNILEKNEMIWRSWFIRVFVTRFFRGLFLFFNYDLSRVRPQHKQQLLKPRLHKTYWTIVWHLKNQQSYHVYNNYKLNLKSYVMFTIFDYVMLYVYGTINLA